MQTPSPLEHFPAWVQTAAYIATALVGLAVASHGYFRAWLKKLGSSEKEEPGVKKIDTVIVMDRSTMQGLTDTLLRLDTTMRSVQDDVRRLEDALERAGRRRHD